MVPKGRHYFYDLLLLLFQLFLSKYIKELFIVIEDLDKIIFLYMNLIQLYDSRSHLIVLFDKPSDFVFLGTFLVLLLILYFFVKHIAIS